MSFLTAEWRKLIFLNYEVNPSALKTYLPYGTELDLWKEKCYISVVGFMFLNTRLLGLKIPFHTNFEEANLRFYVKRKVNGAWRRGTVFIKEIVPMPAITFVANTIYKENYVSRQMRHNWLCSGKYQEISYEWKTNGKWQHISVTADKEPILITPGSEAEFITEHYWGYARITGSKSHEYEVRHPRWLQYNVSQTQISIDFNLEYGSQFGFLTDVNPDSVILAEGSKITIENKSILT